MSLLWIHYYVFESNISWLIDWLIHHWRKVFSNASINKDKENVNAFSTLILLLHGMYHVWSHRKHIFSLFLFLFHIIIMTSMLHWFTHYVSRHSFYSIFPLTLFLSAQSFPGSSCSSSSSLSLFFWLTILAN